MNGQALMCPQKRGGTVDAVARRFDEDPEPTGVLRTTLRRRGGAVVVALAGTAGMNEAQTLARALQAAIRQEAPVIVVDLAGLDFIGSAGLGELITAYWRVQPAGRFRLARPQRQIRDLLGRTCLDRFLPIDDEVYDPSAD